MALTKISGVVSNVRERTEVSRMETHHHSHMNTSHSKVKTKTSINFRVDECPVTMKDSEGIELADGDQATVVGTESGGGIKALLIQNDTTGIVYGWRATYLLVWAVILIVAGFATLAVFIGLLLLPMGLYLLYKWRQYKQAHALLQA